MPAPPPVGGIIAGSAAIMAASQNLRRQAEHRAAVEAANTACTAGDAASCWDAGYYAGITSQSTQNTQPWPLTLIFAAMAIAIIYVLIELIGMGLLSAFGWEIRPWEGWMRRNRGLNSFRAYKDYYGYYR